MESPPTSSSSSAEKKTAPSTTPQPEIEKVSNEQPQDETTKLSDEPKRETTGLRWVIVCIALYVSCFMYGLDTTIAADIQSAVVETFSDVSQLAWIGAGFPLGSVAVILPYGSLFSAFNMKWLYICGIVLFHAGSALCGAAPTMNALIVGRVIAGAGGTGIYLGGLNSLSTLTTPKERGLYITGIACVWSTGCILGPVVGGSFSVSAATWRWSFYMNLVIGAVTAPVYLFFLPSIHPQRTDSVRERLAGLDFLGFALNAGIWVTFSVALISAGGIWAWNDARTIATLVVFGVLLVAYTAQQYFCILTTPSGRSFPCHLLKSRTQLLLYVGTACSTASMFMTTYYMPLYFQFVHNDSALMAAVRLLPFIVVLSILNLSAGWALPKVQFYAPVYLTSGLLMVLGGALFHVYLSPSTSTATIYGISVVVAVGAALTFQIGYAVATIKADPAHIIDAVSLQNVSQVGTNALCLVIAGQVFQSSAVRNLSEVLAGHGFSDADIQDAVAGARSALFAELGDQGLKGEAVLAITDAIQTTFALVIVAGGLGAVASILMRWERLLAA